MKVHELAIRTIEEKLDAIHEEARKVITLRLETVEEEKAATYPPKKEVLGAHVLSLMKQEERLREEALNLAASLRILEDAQDKELEK